MSKILFYIVKLKVNNAAAFVVALLKKRLFMLMLLSKCNVNVKISII